MQIDLLYRAIIDGEVTEYVSGDDIDNAQLTITEEDNNQYILRCHGINYSLSLEKFDTEKKEYVINVEGLHYRVQLQDKLDILIQEMGLNTRREQSHKKLPAPMPGLVLELMIAKNASVNKGDVLVVLEAMKMENVILAPMDGIVKEIYINKGDVVEKGALLLELD